jgi:hypothetical protein
MSASEIKYSVSLLWSAAVDNDIVKLVDRAVLPRTTIGITDRDAHHDPHLGVSSTTAIDLDIEIKLHGTVAAACGSWRVRIQLRSGILRAAIAGTFPSLRCWTASRIYPAYPSALPRINRQRA